MKIMLTLIPIILAITWFIGFFIFNAGYFIHILLVLAIVAALFRLTRGIEINEY